MSKIYQRLLQNKFLILVLSFSLIAFVSLYFADTYFQSTPRLSEIIRSVAVALLTSYVVGFVFEYTTHKELSELVSNSVHEQLVRFFSHKEGNEDLYLFWMSMIDEGLKIIVPVDESGVEPVARVSDITAALNLFGRLIDRYGLPGTKVDVGIEFISKYAPGADIRSFNYNLVIIGAPGANPLATTAMKYLYHFPADIQEVESGYVFAVDSARSPGYLDSPFIMPCGEDGPGLLELHKGKVVAKYGRKDPSRQDGIGRDACLLIAGKFINNMKRTLNVLVIAGCSRFSTLDGVEFVTTNDNWASLLPKKSEPVATATVIETLISAGRRSRVQIARPPHALVF